MCEAYGNARNDLFIAGTRDQFIEQVQKAKDCEMVR
jgi:hypothetical protein